MTSVLELISSWDEKNQAFLLGLTVVAITVVSVVALVSVKLLVDAIGDLIWPNPTYDEYDVYMQLAKSLGSRAVDAAAVQAILLALNPSLTFVTTALPADPDDEEDEEDNT